MAKGINITLLIAYIKGELAKGGERASILAKCREKWQIPPRTFDTHFATAKESYLKDREQIEKAKQEVIKQNEIEALKRDLMGIDERKEILTKIARGEIPLTKPMVCDGEISLVPVVPDWMDRKSAIAELNKMDGAYTPIKVANTDVEGKDKPDIFVLGKINKVNI